MHVATEIAKNAIKGAFPTLVTRLRGTTGRGCGGETPADVLAHQRGTFEAYLRMLALHPGELAGKDVIELGPGDTLVTGRLFLAHGAASYTAVDRFSFPLESELNERVYGLLEQGLDPGARQRLRNSLHRLRVVREPIETFQLAGLADVLVSSAVLEHVRDLDRAMAAMARALKPDGRMAHWVDLRDHNLYPGDPLRFLSYSPALWSAMHCFRGSPNRERLPRYIELCGRHGLAAGQVQVDMRLPIEEVRANRPRFDPMFQSISDDDLTVMGFGFTAQRIVESPRG